MGFDQVSLFLYPPRWQRRSMPSPTKLRYAFTGEPVQVVSAVRVADTDAPPVLLDDVRRWFTSRGFELIADDPGYVIAAEAAVPSALVRRSEIEISAYTEDGEVADLYCRFVLTRDAPLRLERWEALFRDLCGAFGLRIGVADGELAGPEEFLTIVRRRDNWRYFAGQYGWESDGEDELG
jgi:hypothetical protein